MASSQAQDKILSACLFIYTSEIKYKTNAWCCIFETSFRPHVNTAEDKGFFNSRPHHKLPRLVTRLAQMTLSCFLIFHICIRLVTTARLIGPSSNGSSVFWPELRKTHSWTIWKSTHKKIWEEVRGHERHIPLIYWHGVNTEVTLRVQNRSWKLQTQIRLKRGGNETYGWDESILGGDGSE